jgi:hypothetical protein
VLLGMASSSGSGVPMHFVDCVSSGVKVPQADPRTKDPPPGSPGKLFFESPAMLTLAIAACSAWRVGMQGPKSTAQSIGRHETIVMDASLTELASSNVFRGAITLAALFRYTRCGGARVKLFYPASGPSDEEAPYCTDGRVTSDGMAGLVGFRQLGLSFLLEHLASARSGAWLDAPFADTEEPLPILVYSHGFGGNMDMASYLFRACVSRN